MKTEQTFSTVKLPNGKDAVNFTPDITGIAAIVDLKALQRIINHLQSASLERIKSDVVSKVAECGTITELVDILKEELAFHLTVNQVVTFSVEEHAEEMQLG